MFLKFVVQLWINIIKDFQTQYTVRQSLFIWHNALLKQKYIIFSTL